MQRRILQQQKISEEFLMVPRSKVLLVEEDVADREYHQQMLESQGHEVTPCGSYLQGADLAETRDFDFVIVSQGGPAFEGKVVLERLKKRRGESRVSAPTPWDIPVLVLASSLDIDCYLEAMQLGAVDYLEKPIRPADLKRILKLHLESPALAARSDRRM